MEEEPIYQQDIASIRKLMERSVKFISLSGLSGIMAGIYALIGAGTVTYLNGSPVQYWMQPDPEGGTRIMSIAALVLIASLITVFWLTARKSKQAGVRVWDPTSKRLLINLAIPLITGGIFIIALVYQGYASMAAPATLIFYGLALINASPNVYEEVRYLGYSEIILGLIAALIPDDGLIFWALGFGVLHVVYGVVMYKKYEA